jgi:hypothetical protein
MCRHNGQEFYSMDRRGNCWTDDLNEAKQYRGMSRSAYTSITEALASNLDRDNGQHKVYLRIGGKYNYASNIFFTQMELESIELRELFLSI